MIIQMQFHAETMRNIMLNLLQQADARPTSQARAAVPALQMTLAA